MAVLILKNIYSEGPGTIERFLIENRLRYRVVDLETEEIPYKNDFSTLVIMGGPMSVNDDIPYIRREEELVKEFITKGKKILGTCLGAQIMAKALGAKVYTGNKKEIGWYDIELTEDGIKDPVMKTLALHPGPGNFSKMFKVFQWHGETFEIPEGAVRLASSILYPNQAFRYGRNAYAFQFHIEVSKKMVYEWLQNESVDIAMIMSETEMLSEEYHGRAFNFYKAFFL